MAVNPKHIAVALVPIIGIGWYLFRPELLFINQSVNEKLPTNSTQESQEILKIGEFTSYAHETTGKAQIIKLGAKNFLRFTNFHTSNGPDVHVYLVKGKDGSQDGVNKNGFLDLGVIKGNIGDQNYELPADTNLDDYGAVAIWCKRFSVNFGGTELKSDAPKVEAKRLQLTQIAFDKIVVTDGKLSLGGSAA